MKKITSLLLVFVLIFCTIPINTMAAWQKNGNSTWSYTESGKKIIGWKKIGGVWYCFNNSGVMQTGWIKSGGKWYHLKESGAMSTGWLKSGNKWYYLNSDGTMATGWIKSGGEWYYLNSDGSMRNENEQAESNNSTDSAKNGKTYKSILDEYTVKLRNATPGLVKEYKEEARKNTNGLTGLAEICNNKIQELAEISTDGITEMAKLMYTTGSGKYSEYEEWAGKLQDVYMDEAEKITDAYMDSAMG